MQRYLHCDRFSNLAADRAATPLCEKCEISGVSCNSKNNDRGFTLAELLIVVAIIGVLVAISIPIFSGQLEKSRRAVDISNARSIRSAITLALNNGDLEIRDDTTEIVLHVSRDKTDGGAHGTMNNVYIDGVRYPGQSAMWKLFSKYGISDKTRMKQKNPNIDWYAISINAKGESYYYEGKGTMNDYRKSTVAQKYSWSDLNTPIENN